MQIPDDIWIAKVNLDFRNENIDIKSRAFLALDRYCKEFSVISISFDSPIAKKIFGWFQENTKPEAHHIGFMFTSVYYYDACFWPVDIPIISGGHFRIESLEYLRGMPVNLKTDLMSVPRDAWSYALFYVDCQDYAYGFDDMIKLNRDPVFALSLLENANRELRSAVSQLLENHPNSKAAMSARMAVEMYLKAFLAYKANYTEQHLKRFSHRLADLVRECQSIAPEHDILRIESGLAVFPEIHERYTGDNIPNPRLWEAYCIAQYTAAAFVRGFTDRDTRSQLKPSTNAR
jgi:HEPN domain-containing protein